jgi:hypothetical protein
MSGEEILNGVGDGGKMREAYKLAWEKFKKKNTDVYGNKPTLSTFAKTLSAKDARKTYKKRQSTTISKNKWIIFLGDHPYDKSIDGNYKKYLLTMSKAYNEEGHAVKTKKNTKKKTKIEPVKLEPIKKKIKIEPVKLEPIKKKIKIEPVKLEPIKSEPKNWAKELNKIIEESSKAIKSEPENWEKELNKMLEESSKEREPAPYKTEPIKEETWAKEFNKIIEESYKAIKSDPEYWEKELKKIIEAALKSDPEYWEKELKKIIESDLKTGEFDKMFKEYFEAIEPVPYKTGPLNEKFNIYKIIEALKGKGIDDDDDDYGGYYTRNKRNFLKENYESMLKYKKNLEEKGYTSKDIEKI